jgi:hypothetical protein
LIIGKGEMGEKSRSHSDLLKASFIIYGLKNGKHLAEKRFFGKNYLFIKASNGKWIIPFLVESSWCLFMVGAGQERGGSGAEVGQERGRSGQEQAGAGQERGRSRS